MRQHNHKHSERGTVKYMLAQRQFRSITDGQIKELARFGYEGRIPPQRTQTAELLARLNREYVSKKLKVTESR